MKRLTYNIPFLLLVSITWISNGSIILHCGKLIDGKSQDLRHEISIIIESNRISSVSAGFVEPRRGDLVIDLKNKTVLPGLMDMHLHLLNSPAAQGHFERFTVNREEFVYRSVRNARVTLLAGFTSVRDLGGEEVIALKKVIQQGLLDGPRILAAGKSIASTGGHADPSNGYRRDLMGDPGPREGVVNGVDDARKAVRQRYKDGSDVIKMTATGGVLSMAADGVGAHFTQEELNAMVETAKDYGMTTAAHAHGAEGMKRAVLAGVSSIEHGTEMTEEIMELMKKHGTWFVPTISAGKFVAEKGNIKGYYPEMVSHKARTLGPKMQSTFAKALKAGVKIAFGTDAGVFPHGENGHEFIYMVEVGMEPMKAIQSATVEAAKLMRVENELGSIEAGKLADIIAVGENPLQSIHTLTNVLFVMKDGVIYKSAPVKPVN